MGDAAMRGARAFRFMRLPQLQKHRRCCGCSCICNVSADPGCSENKSPLQSLAFSKPLGSASLVGGPHTLCHPRSPSRPHGWIMAFDAGAVYCVLSISDSWSRLRQYLSIHFSCLWTSTRTITEKDVVNEPLRHHQAILGDGALSDANDLPSKTHGPWTEAQGSHRSP